MQQWVCNGWARAGDRRHVDSGNKARSAAAYRASPEGEAKRLAYNQTDERRATLKRYAASDKGKANMARYRATDKGRATRKAAERRMWADPVRARRKIDTANRIYHRKLSARIEANQAEIEAIQKRIRDAN